MFLSRAKVGLLLLAATTLVSFAVVSLVAGEQPKKDDPAAADKEVIDSKATPRTAAATVKFRKELGLPYPSLNTLGSRIDAARRAHDPVALAHAANELSVAEKVSGKKASLLAKELVKESAQLAALRRQETELRAVTTVAQSVADTDDTVTLLKNILASAKAQAAAEEPAAELAEEADILVTMGCGDACPYVPGKRYIDWDLPDPMGRPLAEVRATRDEIERRVRALVDEL